ncbi:MAG: two-component sensor histidine kinase [Burkholderiales bacterium]|nr:two-component sensor histidine kinase [Burkholderiales bacterium]
MRPPPSLVRRLIAWQVGAMVVAWLGLSAFILSRMLASGDGDLDRRIGFLAQSLAEAASAAHGDPVELRRRLHQAEHIFVDGVMAELDAAAGYVPVYQVWSRRGELLYASPAAPAQALSTRASGLGRLRVGGHELRTVAATSEDGLVRVALAERTDDRLAENLPLLRTIALAQLSILGWSLLVMWLAARRGFRPLVELARGIARRAPGDLAPLATDRLYLETAPIVREINGLLAREARRLEVERGFLADAAHELRTPLAAISAQAHLLARAEAPPERQAALDELEQGVERVSHLLSQLLDIARLDAGPVGGAREALDLAELCRQRMAVLTQRARRRAVALELEAPEQLRAQASRSGFLSLLDNLVDNAIRYTQAGGRVAVGLQAEGAEVVLLVRDDGPGIALADRERVFERFVRLGPSAEPGTGLGLAIVRRVVDSQSASLRFVEGLSGRGVGFRVALPRG